MPVDERFEVVMRVCPSLSWLGLMLAATPAAAAHQGLLDAVSSASVVITASTAARTQLSSPRDVALGDGASSQTLCAYGNTLTRLYSVRVATAADPAVHVGLAGAAGGAVPALQEQIAETFGGSCAGPTLVIDSAASAAAGRSRALTLLVAPD